MAAAKPPIIMYGASMRSRVWRISKNKRRSGVRSVSTSNLLEDFQAKGFWRHIGVEAAYATTDGAHRKLARAQHGLQVCARRQLHPQAHVLEVDRVKAPAERPVHGVISRV